VKILAGTLIGSFYRSDGAEAEPFQASLLGAALRSIEKEPAVAGVFLWKWFLNPHPVAGTFSSPRLD
jgi:hypothetical protein